eukprot:10167928-Lingulodinium_polyedra.AAC.1
MALGIEAACRVHESRGALVVEGPIIDLRVHREALGHEQFAGHHPALEGGGVQEPDVVDDAVQVFAGRSGAHASQGILVELVDQLAIGVFRHVLFQVRDLRGVEGRPEAGGVVGVQRRFPERARGLPVLRPLNLLDELVFTHGSLVRLVVAVLVGEEVLAPGRLARPPETPGEAAQGR